MTVCIVTKNNQPTETPKEPCLGHEDKFFICINTLADDDAKSSRICGMNDSSKTWISVDQNAM